MSGRFQVSVGGTVYEFDSAEERGEFLGMLDTCTFVRDEKNPYQDYWFCHCSECGYKSNTVLTEGSGSRDAWNFCPKCGRAVRR